MKPSRMIVVLALVATACATAPPTELARQRAESQIDATTAATSASELRELEQLVNQHRRRIGRAPLVWDRTLARVAMRHSEDMAERGYMGHVNPDGEDPFDRIRAAGIEYRAAGENVAAGHRDARSVFDAWMSSRGHRANIERRTFTHHGVGLYQNRWTHVFAGLRSAR